MGITQAQADKNWQDSPSTATPILAADLKALSRRDRSYVTMAPSSMVSIDEFDDDTLDAAWVRVDGTGALATNIAWTEAGDALSLYQGGGDSGSVIHGLMRPLSGAGGSVAVGDGFVTAVRLFGPNVQFTMSGIVLSDGTTPNSGSQAVAMLYLDNTGNNCAAWSGSGWTLSSTTGNTTLVYGARFFLRFAYIGTNTWRADVSPDGISWIKHTATLSRAITPTHVGLAASSWGSSTKGVVSYEFLRRVSGVS